MKLTASQKRALSYSKWFLNKSLCAAKNEGRVPLDASLEVDAEFAEEGMAKVYSAIEGRRPLYIASFRPETLDVETVGHEAGHILKGHPAKGPYSDQLLEQNDFLSYFEREISADFEFHKRVGTLDEFYEDLYSYVRNAGEFGLTYPDAYGAVKESARKVGVPFRYIKEARRALESEGYL
jgi:hypothetical protein